MSGWLDALLGRIRDAGTAINLGYGINFSTGIRARLNTTTKFIDVDLRDAGVTPTHLAAESNGVAPVFVLRIPITAGTPGSPGDVAGSAAPAACRIIDRWADVTTAIGASTLTVRSATGGGGNTLSGSISSDTVAEGVRAASGAVSAQSTLAAGAIPQVRCSDRGVAGTVYLLCERT